MTTDSKEKSADSKGETLRLNYDPDDDTPSVYPNSVLEFMNSRGTSSDFDKELLKNFYQRSAGFDRSNFPQSMVDTNLDKRDMEWTQRRLSYSPFEVRRLMYNAGHAGEHSADLIGDSLWHEEVVNCRSTHALCFGQNVRTNRVRRCLCQEECREYGNCCLDYPLGPLSVNSSIERRWSCTEVKEGVAYYVISNCPDDWNNSHVQLQCEGKDYNRSDSFRRIPVTSMDTLLTYRNVYCAICNEDLNATFWSTELNCPQSVRIHVDSLHRTNINGCKTSFSVPVLECNSTDRCTPTLPLIRCDTSLVSECPEAWKNNNDSKYIVDITAKCALIYAPVSRTSFPATIKYKNKYCAMCNGVDDVELMCPATASWSKPNTVKPALSLLLDMDFTQGGSMVGSQNRCPKMHLYDPWRKKCRNVMCGWQYTYEQGKCILNTDAKREEEQKYGSIKLKFDGFLQSDCLRTKFVADEVSLLENGTLVILDGDVTFQPGEYEHDENSSITVCVPPTMEYEYVDTFTDLQGSLTIVGICISLLSLLIKIGFSLFTNERTKLPSRIVLFLSISLFFAQLLFLVGIYRTELPVLCTVMGIVLHYCFLSSFFWMNVLAYDIWRTFASSESMTKGVMMSKKLYRYCLYGWLTPLAIVLVAVIANWYIDYPLLNPQYGESVCWISNKVALAVFFAAPLAILLLMNVVFFTITAVEIRKTTVATKAVVKNSKSGRDRVEFGLYCKLACIMGLTWIFGFVAAFAGSMTLWYFFIVFNSIQGVYVLVAFTHFQIPKWFRPKQLMYMSSKQSAASRSSVTFSTSVSKP